MKTYAVLTPIREVKEGWRFKVKSPNWPEDEWLTHTYATKELAQLGRDGWLSYFMERHVSVRSKLSAQAT